MHYIALTADYNYHQQWSPYSFDDLQERLAVLDILALSADNRAQYRYVAQLD